MYGFPHAVTILRAPAAVDGNGTELPQRLWEAAVETLVSGVNVQPARSSRSARDDGYRTTQQWRLFTRPGQDIDLLSTDRVRFGPLLLAVAGEPQRWPGFGGGVHHVEAVLELAPMESGEGGSTASGQLATGVRAAAARGARWTP